MLAGLVAGHKSRMLISSLFMLQLSGTVSSGFMWWAHHKSLRKARSGDLGTYTCDSGRVSAKRVCSQLISEPFPALVRLYQNPSKMSRTSVFCILLQPSCGSLYFFWHLGKITCGWNEPSKASGPHLISRRRSSLQHLARHSGNKWISDLSREMKSFLRGSSMGFMQIKEQKEEMPKKFRINIPWFLSLTCDLFLVHSWRFS